MSNDEILDLARTVGFSQFGFLNPDKLKFIPEVREMCAANRCNHFGKSWMCPPACGSLEEAAARVSAYTNVLLLQSTGAMRDDFDVETMSETEKIHKKKFHQLIEEIDSLQLSFLPMGAGACSLCAECTYPGSPCRTPHQAYPSMEAYGLVVSDVCTEANIPYYYGKHTITFTSCILWGRNLNPTFMNQQK